MVPVLAGTELYKMIEFLTEILGTVK
jgi:hypothetical protein